jgi:fructose-1,6-bisphosphatase/inositol monophosphatase family enzyme
VRPWLDVCREAVGDIKAVLVELPTRAEREPVLQLGEGGDETTAIDAAAETAVVHRLERLDEGFTLVSEELGERVFNGGGTTWVVCDPIDGSLNAKRDIPFFSLSLAVAEGATMADVVFGYVYDFGSGEEWIATRGGGAFLNGRRLGDVRPKDEIEEAVQATNVSESELDMAKQLVESLSKPFDPDEFENEHKRELLALVERKLAGEEIAPAPEAPAPAPVPDLMSALKASLEEAKQEKRTGAPASAANGGARGKKRAAKAGSASKRGSGAAKKSGGAKKKRATATGAGRGRST